MKATFSVRALAKTVKAQELTIMRITRIEVIIDTDFFIFINLSQKK